MVVLRGLRKVGRAFCELGGGIHTINVPQPRSVTMDSGNRKKRDGDVCGEGEEVGSEGREWRGLQTSSPTSREFYD